MGKKKKTKEEFIKEATEKHKGKYDYTKVEYIGALKKVCIICPRHGEFKQKASGHLSGYGCPKCGVEKQTLHGKKFIKKTREVHGDKYDYSKVEYVNNKTKVCIICPNHGEFWQTPADHLSGHGCTKCKGDKNREKLSISKDDFIKKARKVHGDKYDYSKVDYVNNYTKVCIICFEHGEFWQIPNSHLNGNGCPKCNSSKLEGIIRKFFTESGITFNEQYRVKWLGKQSLDFYLPEYKVGIECQGLQHFESVEYFGGKEGLNECKKRDKLKFKKCQKHGIKLLYYSDLGIEYPYEVFEDVDLLFEEIKNIQVKKK